MFIRLPQIPNTNNIKSCWGCGVTRALTHCGLKWKMVQLLWKTLWQFLSKFNTLLPSEYAHAQSCPILLQPHGLYSPWNSPGQGTGVGSLSLLWGSNPGLLPCRQIPYQLSHQGSPRTLEWVAIPFSRGSSRPRDRTWASRIAGRFFTSRAAR